jgi:2'-5' RNA ligase
VTGAAVTRTGRVRTEITGLVVPVPEAERYAAHPHVTLLAPFGSRERADDAHLQNELRGYFASVAPFEFMLMDVRQFPAGMYYLAPEPAERFRAITNALTMRYPDYPPYEGQFRDIIPHLTIEDDARPEKLPIAARATIAELVHSHDTSWDVIARFPFTG